MSNNRHKYFNKVPPFKPDPEHYTRKRSSKHRDIRCIGAGPATNGTWDISPTKNNKTTEDT